MSREPVARVALRYAVDAVPEAWVLPEGLVPESITHQEAAERLKQLLDAWRARTGRDALVARNLAIRFLERAPRIGIDPDVCVVEPAPPGAAELSSLRLWKDRAVPTLCFEVVSAGHPHKDYAALQDRYAAIGARELCVFDPLLAGPAALGGPVALQLWRRDPAGILERVAAGPGPVYSETLDAWIHAEGRTLALSDDRSGLRRWQTGEERERAEKERERAEKEREKAEKEREKAAREELERRLAALERRGTPH